MICKNCGTEIADKALVCFRCGAATFEPKTKPAPRASSRSSLPAALALIVLVLAALFMSQAVTGEAPRIVSWVVAALAVLLLVWRLVRRRR
jgi:Flp pilus assembly protein TadB